MGKELHSCGKSIKRDACVRKETYFKMSKEIYENKLFLCWKHAKRDVCARKTSWLTYQHPHVQKSCICVGIVSKETYIWEKRPAWDTKTDMWKWANWHTNMHMFERAAFAWKTCQRRIHVERDRVERPKQICEKVLLLLGNKSKERYAYEKRPTRHTNRHVQKICTKMAKETYLRIQTSSGYQTRWVQKMHLCCSFGMFKNKKKAIIVDLMPSKKKGFPKNKKFPM